MEGKQVFRDKSGRFEVTCNVTNHSAGSISVECVEMKRILVQSPHKSAQRLVNKLNKLISKKSAPLINISTESHNLISFDSGLVNGNGWIVK